MDPFTAAMIANVIGSVVSGAGAAAGADAQADAAESSAKLQKQIYDDQARRNEPWRQSGVNALNFQNQWLGLPGVSNTGGGDTSRLIGGGEDQWMAYLNAYPGLQAEWTRLTTQKKNPFSTPAEYAQWHYTTLGQGKGFHLPDMGDKSNQPVGGAQEAGQPAQGANGVWDTIKKNPLWAAGMEVNDAEFDKIKGQLGAAGKSISGAAEGRYANALKDNTYRVVGDIYNQYAGVSGTGYTATQDTNRAAGQMGANVGNSMMARGNALASGYAGVAQGVGNAISGGADAYFRYGGGSGGGSGGNYSGYKNRY